MTERDFVLIYAKHLVSGDRFRYRGTEIEAKMVAPDSHECPTCHGPVVKVRITFDGGYVTLGLEEPVGVTSGPSWDTWHDSERKRRLGLVDRHMLP